MCRSAAIACGLVVLGESGTATVRMTVGNPHGALSPGMLCHVRIIMVALYRVLREGMSADDAFAEMQKYHLGNGHQVLRDYPYRRASEGSAVLAGAEA